MMFLTGSVLTPVIKYGPNAKMALTRKLRAD
jgi:hypothetical protein